MTGSPRPPLVFQVEVDTPAPQVEVPVGEPVVVLAAVPVPGPQGPIGISATAAPYKWKSATTASDPGSGFIKGNNASVTAITELYVSVHDQNGQALLALTTLGADETVFLYESGQFDTWNEYRLTGSPILIGGTWATVPVLYAATGPSAFTPGNNTPITLTTPVRGEPGPPGPGSPFLVLTQAEFDALDEEPPGVLVVVVPG